MQVDKKSLDFRLMCQLTDMPPLEFTPLTDGDCFERHSHCWYMAKTFPKYYPGRRRSKEESKRCFLRFLHTFGEN
jgi:hypothetical protein